MLRKRVLFAALVGAVSYGSLNVAHAQGLPPDDGGFEIETTDDSARSGGFLENLSQYIGVTAGANSGTSDAVEKTIQGLSLALDLPSFANLKSSITVDVGNYENVYKLELNDYSKNRLNDCQQQGLDPDNALNGGNFDANFGGIPNQRYVDLDCDRVSSDGEWLAPTLERTVDASFTELTEGYVQWEPTSFATLRVGRQPIVLGQFEVFSPLMFTTPMRATGTKTKTGKSDMAFSQDGFQLSLFPLSRLEVSYTHVPEMRIDAANRKRFEEFAALKGDFMNFAPKAGGVGGQVDQVDTLQDIAENDLSVLRMMYFGDRFTFGLTQIEGAETNEDPLREAELQAVACGSYFATGEDYSYTECGSNAFTSYAVGNDKGLRFAEMEATAVELSYRVSDRWTFVLEHTMVEGERELDQLPFGGLQGFVPRNFRTQDSLLPIYAELLTDNDAKPYINVDTVMQSVGMVYKGDRWLLNLQVAQRTQEGATDQEEAWRKALDPAEMEGDADEDDTLPILNAVRLLGAEKQGYAGFGFGAFGQNFGFGLSTGWRYFEKLEVGFFGGVALDVTGSDEIETEGYESAEGESYASFGINYLF
jgi:hypothetical protein